MYLAPNRLLQSAFVEVSSTQTTVLGPYNNLITIPITTTTGKYLMIEASFGVIGSLTANADFRILVDGVARRGCRVVVTSILFEAGTIAQRIAITPGSHTVTLQWGGSAGTLTINPATNGQHASLRVRELAA